MLLPDVLSRSLQISLTDSTHAIATHPAQDILETVVVVRLVGASSLEIVDNLRDIVSGSQAQDQMHVIAHDALFQQMYLQFGAFVGKELPGMQQPPG
jgi:hypothetical protein